MTSNIPARSNDQNDRRTALLAAFSKSIQNFLAIAESYPRPLVREKPNRNAFSACEVLYHMLDVEQLWQQRIHGMVDGTIDKFQQMNPDKEAALKRYNSKQYERGLRELAQSRAQTAAQILQLSPAELARTALHPKFGPMNTLKILETMEAHDRQHAAQLEKTLALVASTTTATAGTGC